MPKEILCETCEEIIIKIKPCASNTPKPSEPKKPTNKNNLPYLIFLPLLAFMVFALVLFLQSISCNTPVVPYSKIVFLIIALTSSYIYGRHAFEIHNVKTLTEKDRENKWYMLNQYWFNGLGAFIGWVSLYILLFYRININVQGVDFSSFAKNLGLANLALTIISYLGITGYIPLASLLKRSGF